ncbi:MAG: type I-E CRISPR-associated protein Cas6/Cse3/CasE [PVC group bacterium]|nr:type I-E CRISPR-associated protein Cas6/Cse3/CasE [PVC group bacterium]
MIASVYELSREDFAELKISDAYSIHRIVYELFPDQRTDQDRNRQVTKGFLFADKGGTWEHRKILILSDRKPLQPKNGTITSRVIPKTFLSHDYYGFEITLNPTKRDNTTRKTVAIRGKEELMQWFINKTPQYGFNVDQRSIQVQNIGFQRFKKDDAVLTHSSATFKGKLKVIDREKFIKGFELGIGRARGFGFGLLQIVPLQINNDF